QKATLALVWGHVLISLASILISEAVITGGGILGCKPCAIDDCKNETNCPLGFVMDVCNCCTKCLRVNGQTCGGKGYVVGRCGKGLKCNLASASYQHPVGICISLIKPTSQPAQKLLIDRPINGGENFPRQDIPGSNHRKEGNDLPGDDAKYYVHPNGMWSIHTVKIQDDIAASKFVVYIFSASVQDSIPDVTPAVIFVAASGAIFLCLIGLLFLPIARKR
ncbi:unnamed protein product, partial [Pocillopora meandrina]